MLMRLWNGLLVGAGLIIVSRVALAGDAAAVKVVPPKAIVEGAEVVTLWPAESLSLKGGVAEEKFNMTPGQPERVQSVENIHNPSIELYLAPEGNRNGTGIMLAAGGGNRTVNVGTEGVDVARWLNTLGVSAFVLRYRIVPYASDGEGLADSLRAVRLVRARAAEWGVDPKKIGFMGFSAGGEQAARVTLKFDRGHEDAADAVERVSSRPDFSVLVYAGWRQLDVSQVPADAPPTFLTSAGVDDAFHARQTVEFYSALFEKKIPVELHIYGHGGHGGGIKPRDGIPFGTWQERFVEWARDAGMMK